MTTIEKLKEAGMPTAASHLESLIGPIGDRVTIRDTDHKAYDTGLAQWLTDNCKWSNIGTGFLARIEK